MTITLLAPDGVAVTAQQERQAKAAHHGAGFGRPLGGRSGFRVGTPSNVLTATSTTWTLVPCGAMIDPGASTHQGMYGWATDANISGAITAADATYSRKDIVYIQINDPTAGDGSASVSYAPQYLAGTPAASPAAPALPARSFLIGTINMPQAGGGSPTVTVNPARYVGAGAVQPVFSPGDRAAVSAPYVGQEIQRLDLTQLSPSGIRERWNGATWDHLGHIEFTTPPNAASQNTAWGMGTFSRDTARSTDDTFVTIAGTDQLQIRDAGLYSITVLVSFTSAVGGISWLSVDGSYTVTMGGGLQNFIATMPNVTLAAGQILKPLLAHGSGGDRTFTSRVRITRIA
ncbi:hypothetical protein J7I84_08815 [Arthrobacter sp. ISL-85]|uniref:hypothetical protein n=1 Tax=Arthrobacter sp. ISL-85 TaxID=2819115 RepID=UPI001BE54D68|nr:hypothetical protein [Arthrobacter sp. ISL-85]MBT2566593.1 hypothetical protein [Arthrobacter sp. ISL-85]